MTHTTTAKLAATALVMFLTIGDWSTIHAFSADALIQETAYEEPPRLPEKPVRVDLKRHDGSEIHETVTGWSAEGIHGAFGTCEWAEIIPDDVWQTYQRLMDRGSAELWVELGGLMLMWDEDEERAEEAFARATRLDGSVEAEIDDVRSRVTSAREARAEIARQSRAAKLSTVTPEAQLYPSRPWPRMTLVEREEKARAMRAAASEVMMQSGLPRSVVETPHFLMYTDVLDSEVTDRLSLVLELSYDRTLRLLGLASDALVFPGKAAVYVTGSRDRFLLIESQCFDHYPGDSTYSRCHVDDRRVFLVQHHAGDVQSTAFGLTRQVLFGVLHNFESPIRLPAWANEGLATWLAIEDDPYGALAKEIRATAVRGLRQSPAQAVTMMSTDYRDEGFGANESVIGGLGYLVVDWMQTRRPQEFQAFVLSTKRGTVWTQAMRSTMNGSWEEVVQAIVSYYRTND